MPTETKACQEQQVKRGMPEAYYQLHALLETLRTMASHEDDVCTLLTHMRRTRKLSAAVRREVEQVLEGLPVERLLQELHALRTELDTDAP